MKEFLLFVLTIFMTILRCKAVINKINVFRILVSDDYIIKLDIIVDVPNLMKPLNLL